MKFKSNLVCPDLSGYFKLLDPPMQRCGHDIPSDPDYDPACGYWSHDEAAILYNVAKQLVGGRWLDIGARFGWTAAHLVAAGASMVHCVDPHFVEPAFRGRMKENTHGPAKKILLCPWESEKHFERMGEQVYAGVVIDGNHDSPEPLRDATRAWANGRVNHDGAILFHDFIGKPTRDAVNFLIDEGFKCRIYWTPNLVALCWRGDLIVPPDHQPDKNIFWKPHMMEMERDFDFGRCS